MTFGKELNEVRGGAMGTLGEKKAFQTERKADAKALRELPGIWSRRAETSVSGTKWETGRMFGGVVRKGAGTWSRGPCQSWQGV